MRRNLLIFNFLILKQKVKLFAGKTSQVSSLLNNLVQITRVADGAYHQLQEAPSPWTIFVSF